MAIENLTKEKPNRHEVVSDLAVKLGEKITLQGKLEIQIQGACEVTNRGHWVCVVCSAHCYTRIDKERHLKKPQAHRLAWFCEKDGCYEQP